MQKLTIKYLNLIVEPQARQFCGPIYFSDSIETPVGHVVANGSFGLVDTGSKKLLVTCFHVWDEFAKLRKRNPALMMHICLDVKNPVIFEPDKPLGEDRTLDIATFDMEPYLGACGGRKFFNLTQNPPPKVKKGDALYFIGFPGNLRFNDGNTLGFVRSPYAVCVASTDALRFQSDVTSIRTDQPDQFGGISGCPCFLVRENKPIQLVGFSTQFGMNLLFFTHARCLNPDGTINNLS